MLMRLLIVLALFGVSSLSLAQTITVQRDGVTVYSFTCPSSPPPPPGPTPCTSWIYSPWSPDPCTPGQTQTRSVIGRSPTGCTGDPPDTELSRPCPSPGPVTPPPASWIKLNNRCAQSQFFGYCPSVPGAEQLTVLGGKTVNFLIDPSWGGYVPGAYRLALLMGHPSCVSTVRVYKLDASYKVVANLSSRVTCDYVCNIHWLKTDPLWSGESYLVTVTPTDTVSIFAQWWMN